ncbi:MAG: type II toxin-antitoxin system prevent-host-death family antitoxin [Abditibacteriaceae bacterium]
MIRATDIYSLTDFQRNAKSHIKHVTETKHPIALTVNGTAEVVVQDASVYQKMVDDLEDLHMATAVLEGEMSILRGGTIPAEEVWAELEKEFDL